ncbi:MAG: hypothetical protein D6816_17540 [Bacteroidetes bacterium]|nr:MAG: hypothetical protein D6816_17540 [Bacteroidota bacterium]
MEAAVTEKGKTIQIGSVIHLENGAPGGGFLETRGRVQDKPVITKWQDARIRTFVMTHENPNRDMGSGSWRVLSAAGKATGEPLKVGDKIHLLNMYPGAGYLDSFEWVPNLEPFKDYPMTIGVFTANTPTRGGGPSGTWVVRSATGKADGTPVAAGDAIYLENAYPGAGFLHSYAEEKVTDHPLFEEYDGNQKFVFTAATPTQTHGSHSWTITLSQLLENSYRIQLQWQDESAPWHDGGVFKIGGRMQKPVTALKLTLEDGSKNLTGQVIFQGEKPVNVTAKWHSQNSYTITLPGADDPRLAGIEWHIGSREGQNVAALDVTSADGGQTWQGTITYAGEGPIRLKAIRESGDTRLSAADAAAQTLLKGRISRLDGVIDTTYKLLSDAFAEISGVTLHEALTGSTWDKPAADDTDRDFQLKQLLNLYTLSQNLNAFFRGTLQTLVKDVMIKHQLADTRPPLHLIRACFQRVAADHEIIQQAAIQRRWNKHLDGRFHMSQQAMELLVMDKLAWQAIAPFQHLLENKARQLAVITYLSERTHIHHVPYAPDFVLVGLSYDRVPPASSLFEDTAVSHHDFPSAELLAIPHEIGHHIYEHGCLSDGKTFSQISEQFRDNPYYAWCEELFADLYGCVVAGPLSVLGMQALLISLDRQRFWKDDEEHPTPLLRVFLMAEMLRVLGEIELRQAGPDGTCERYCFDEITAMMDDDWAKILGQWQYERLDEGNGRPHRVYLPDPTASQLDKIVNVKRVVKTVRPIILEFAEYLLNNFKQPVAMPLDTPWNKSAERDDIAFYTEQMRGLRTRDFANKKMRIQWQKAGEGETAIPYPDDTSNPEERLRRILEEWSNSGPTGHGDHPD